MWKCHENIEVGVENKDSRKEEEKETMSLNLLQGYSSAEEEDEDLNYNNSSDEDDDASLTGRRNSIFDLPKSSANSALPSAFDAFSEVIPSLLFFFFNDIFVIRLWFYWFRFQGHLSSSTIASNTLIQLETSSIISLVDGGTASKNRIYLMVLSSHTLIFISFDLYLSERISILWIPLYEFFFVIIQPFYYYF